ncbi:hypothetical protein HanRHA438_Chr10g0454311 [Helianthus annuus]|nr:hypothetical protein HanIR_Chr10g0476691 [Helianthus annuus]KAJ0700357.1 hypothetical protein HanOQP8_Chr10g0366881 [Helianthus annuus]KAJ0743827.1 hypothetical protein HanPI659440_Chr10g0380461 [Helianthus annuus]KAJ0879679.1 hypothetical protein HanRHA438_Chr10g0454311 [Helianthus annuus]
MDSSDVGFSFEVSKVLGTESEIWLMVSTGLVLEMGPKRSFLHTGRTLIRASGTVGMDSSNVNAFLIGHSSCCFW